MPVPARVLPAAQAWADLEAQNRARDALWAEHKPTFAALDTIIRQRFEASDAAWRRHSAAKGLVTRAVRAGDPARLQAARAREAEAYADAQRISRQCVAEMRAACAEYLARLREITEQSTRCWQAQLVWMDGTLAHLAGRLR